MNWYYYDKNGEKIGPITPKALKQLASQGHITPETKIENQGGRVAVAGKVNGLTFGEPVLAKPYGLASPPLPIPPSEPNPFVNAAPITENPFTNMPLPPSVSLPAGVPVQATQRMAKSTPLFVVKFVEIAWSTRRRKVITIIATVIALFIIGSVSPESSGSLYSKATIAKQVDAVGKEKDYKFSDDTKLLVVDYLLLLQKERKIKHTQPELETVMDCVRIVSLRGISLDAYTLTTQHIETLEGARRLALQNSVNAIDEAKKNGRNVTSVIEVHKERRAKLESTLKTLENMLPKANKMSENAHDAVEQKRLENIQKEKDKDQQRKDAKSLF